MPSLQKIKTALWFDGQAEEAINLYISLFPDAKLLSETRQPGQTPGKPGPILHATLQLAGQEFIAINGGSQYKFTEAISLSVSCESQEEVDHYWDALTAHGGEEGQCGWLKDQFGLSWQIVPTALVRALSHPEPEKARRAVEAMLQMKKIDIARLEAAMR
jgi:predicted 3-demethylubiquinone-9 3-methyltransferase (glyoxalase superfamily)